MSTVKTVAKNTFVLMAAQTINRVMSFILIMYVARFLGDIGLGKYSFALAFSELFVILSDLGLSTLSTREVARNKHIAGKYLGNGATIKFILSILAYGLIFITIGLMDYPHDTTIVVYIIGLSVILNSLAQFLQSIFRAFEKMEYEAISIFIQKIVITGGGISILILGYGLIELVLVVLFGSIINLLFSLFVMVTKFAKPEFQTDWGFWKSAIKKALPFGLAIICSTIYFQIDTVMLSIMKGDAVVGWYNAAYKLIFALMFIPTALVNSIFPVLSRFYVSSKDSLRRAYDKSFKYLFIIGFPLAMGTTILAGRIILLIYGKGFVHSVIALQILIWAALLMFLTYLLGNTLGAIDKQPLVLKVATVNAGVNILLNLLLIPRFSYIGASIATVATEAIGFALLFYFTSKYIYKLPLHNYVIRPIMASLAMSTLLFYPKGTSLLLLIPAAILLYFGVLYLLKAFSKEDVDLIKRVLKGGSVT